MPNAPAHPPYRPRLLSPLRVDVTPEGVDLFTPPQLYRRRAVVVFALPALLALLVVLAALVGGADEEELLLLGALVAVVGVVCAVSGVCLLLFANHFSAWTRWRLTRTHDLRASPMFLFTRGAKHISCQAAPGAKAVLKPGLLGESLWIVDARGRDLCRLFPIVPKPYHADIVHAAQTLNLYLGASDAEAVGASYLPAVTYDARGNLIPTPGERSLAMLCYLPVQGVFLLASLGVLLASRSAYARAAAKQSLLQLCFSVCLLAAILLGLGVPVAYADGSPLQPVLGVALALALTAFWLWNLVAHIYACVRFYRGAPWVMPWLRPLAARWFSPPPQR